MKKLEAKQSVINKAFFAMFLLVVMIMPEFAFAQAGGIGSGFLSLVNNGTFKAIVTFGISCYAGWCWIQFFESLNMGSVFTSIVKPGVMTFLAFKWAELLTFFLKDK